MRGRDKIAGALHLWVILNREFRVTINRIGAQPAGAPAARVWRSQCCHWTGEHRASGAQTICCQGPTQSVGEAVSPCVDSSGQGGACLKELVDIQGLWGAALVHDFPRCRVAELHELCHGVAVPSGNTVLVDASHEFKPFWWPPLLPARVMWCAASSYCHCFQPCAHLVKLVTCQKSNIRSSRFWHATKCIKRVCALQLSKRIEDAHDRVKFAFVRTALPAGLAGAQSLAVDVACVHMQFTVHLRRNHIILTLADGPDGCESSHPACGAADACR